MVRITSIPSGDGNNTLSRHATETGAVKRRLLWTWMLVQTYSVSTLFITSVVGVMRFGFLFLTETAINIGYSCHLLTDDMTEVFVINGETLESVQQAIAEYKSKVLAGASEPKSQKVNSLRDVDVEVLSYKAHKDAVDIPTSTQVIIHRTLSLARDWSKSVT